MNNRYLTYKITIIILVLTALIFPSFSFGQQNIRTIEIDELVVRGGRVKYRNRGNPAVVLIDSVIAYKEQNRSTNFESLSTGNMKKLYSHLQT